ncbi:unnamed protein product [Caretta caretta]
METGLCFSCSNSEPYSSKYSRRTSSGSKEPEYPSITEGLRKEKSRNSHLTSALHLQSFSCQGCFRSSTLHVWIALRLAMWKGSPVQNFENHWTR